MVLGHQWYWNAIVYWEFVHRTIDYRFQKNMVLQWVYSRWVDLNYLFVFYGNTRGNARVCHSSGAYIAEVFIVLWVANKMIKYDEQEKLRFIELSHFPSTVDGSI